MANQYTAPDNQGKAYDFSSAEINLGGNIYTAISNISHNQPLEEGEINGTSAEVLKRTRGKVGMGEGNIEFSDFEEAVKLIEDLGDGWGEIVFPITIVYTAPSKPIIKMELVGARLLDIELDHETGADGLPATLPISFMRRLINGKRMLRQQ